MTEYVLIKGFMPTLCKAGHQNISTDTAGISGSPGWVTLNEVSGSSHHMPLSGHITSTVVLVVVVLILH